MEKEKLIVLDAESAQAYIFDLPPYVEDIPKDKQAEFDVEEYLDKKGFSVSNCQWQIVKRIINESSTTICRESTKS